MSLDQRARDAGAEVRDQVATIEPPTAGAIARRSRRGRVATGVAAVAVLALAGAGSPSPCRNDPDAHLAADHRRPRARRLTVLAGGDVPVWYDAKGLHRGDVVEQTPVEIVASRSGTTSVEGALALVRSGAVYLDPATGDVWFHPWGGEPRIVGHNSRRAPAGTRTATPPPGSRDRRARRLRHGRRPRDLADLAVPAASAPTQW